MLMISKDSSTLITELAGCHVHFGNSLAQQQTLGQTKAPGMRYGIFAKKIIQPEILTKITFLV